MAERWLVPMVLLMIGLAGIYAFDIYHEAAGLTGFIVNTDTIDCRESDANNPAISGITSSSMFENGYEEDRCVGNDLLEFYCGEDGPSVRGVNCGDGCSEGACR